MLLLSVVPTRSKKSDLSQIDTDAREEGVHISSKFLFCLRYLDIFSGTGDCHHRGFNFLRLSIVQVALLSPFRSSLQRSRRPLSLSDSIYSAHIYMPLPIFFLATSNGSQENVQAKPLHSTLSICLACDTLQTASGARRRRSTRKARRPNLLQGTQMDAMLKKDQKIC